MTDALNAAASSMAADVARLSTIGQNLVNAATAGYKRDVVLGVPFEQQWLDAAGRGLPATATDHRVGTLRPTGQALDFAIDGEGFFEVATETGLAYTRRGDFRIDPSGRLVTQQGHVVQGMGGPLQMSSETGVTAGRDGRLQEGDKTIGQLKIVHFENTKQLVRRAGGVFEAAQAPLVLPEGATSVRQGYLEASNVNTAAEMVKLIETMRHFEATQKVVQGVDEMMERALRKLGEF